MPSTDVTLIGRDVVDAVGLVAKVVEVVAGGGTIVVGSMSINWGLSQTSGSVQEKSGRRMPVLTKLVTLSA